MYSSCVGTEAFRTEYGEDVTDKRRVVAQASVGLERGIRATHLCMHRNDYMMPRLPRESCTAVPTSGVTWIVEYASCRTEFME
jgi:hypothetical protein